MLCKNGPQRRGALPLSKTGAATMTARYNVAVWKSLTFRRRVTIARVRCECELFSSVYKLPFTQVQDYIGEPVDGEDIVEFRLLYSGRVLGASRYDTRPILKHKIRKQFHPQLERLWKTNYNLRQFCQGLFYSDGERNAARVAKVQGIPESECLLEFVDAYDKLHEEERFAKGLALIQKNWERFGYKFVPLVTDELCLRCSLDILFLRPEEPGLLIRSGDLDARVKTIFDALRMPKNLDEVGRMGPEEGEEPFYCLLEDDKLISEIRVTTDQLLLLPKEKQLEANDVFLVVNIKLKPTRAGLFS